MATDLERLVVQMSADFKSYETAFAKATGVTRQQLAVIKGEAANTGKASEAAFAGAGRGVQRFGQQAQQAHGGVQNLRLQTANLGAQFQDIAVQLQSGTSPFTIALQQGTQISSVLGGSGAGGAVRALGAAFASIVSPVSLVTIGIIAAGGAAVQYFSSLLSDGEKSAEELKKQADLIQQVAKEWGDALPFVRDYAAAVEQAASAEQAREAGAAVISDIWAPMKENVAAAGLEVDDLTRKLTDLGADQSSIVTLQDAFATLEANVKAETATAADADAVTAALNGTMSGGIPLAGGLADAMAALSVQLGAVVGQADAAKASLDAAVGARARFRASEDMRRSVRENATDTAAWTAEQERLSGLTAEQLESERGIADAKRDAASEGLVIDDAAALEVAQGRADAEERRAAAAKAAKAAGGGGGGGGRADIDREREAVTKLIEQLEYESTLIGKTALEKERMNALRRAGAAATPQETARIEELVEANYREVEAIRAIEDQMQMLKGVSSDVLGGMFEDMRDGVDAADLLTNALNRMLEAFAQMAIDRAITAAFPTPGATPTAGAGIGGFLGSLIGVRQHTGGTVGQSGYMGRAYPAAMWANAPRFHNGGEVPAMLLPGERVLSRREAAGYGGGVTVNLYGAPAGTQVEERTGSGGTRQIQIYLRDQVKGLFARGELDGAMRHSFGIGRQPRDR